MNKLLRRFSFMGSKDDKPPYVRARQAQMQKDLCAYFDSTPVGKVRDWAGGKLIRNATDATFIDLSGRKVDFGPDESLMRLYQNYYIKKEWDNSYNVGCPELLIEPMSLDNSVTHDKNQVSSVRNTQYVDASCCMYRDLVQQYIQTFELIAAEVALQFPDRRAAKLTYSDAGSASGICPDHATHSGLPPACLDIQYYTKGATNYTQYGTPRTFIWNNGVLNKALFDAERMAMLILLMAEAFPCLTDGICNSQVLAWPDIKQAMMSVYPVNSAEWKLINDIVQADDTPNLNHNTHMHVYLVGEINYKMVV